MNEGTLGVSIVALFGLAGQIVNSVWGPRLTAVITARGQAEAKAAQLTAREQADAEIGTDNTRLRRGIRMHIPICDEPDDLLALLKPPPTT